MPIRASHGSPRARPNADGRGGSAPRLRLVAAPTPEGAPQQGPDGEPADGAAPWVASPANVLRAGISAALWAVGLACGFAAAMALAGCKKEEAATKVAVGPFSAARYEAKASDGTRLECFVFGGESNKPARLCGEGSPTPGFTGLLFAARAPAPGSRFLEAVGEPLPEGYYLLRPAGQASVDTWPLGKMAMREWLAGGKALLGVAATDDHHTHVRLIDPVGRSERNFDVGPMRAGDNFLLVRAPGDASLLLVQKLGGSELVLVRDPVGNAELSVADASDGKSAGNRKLFGRGDLARQNGGQFIPGAAELASVSWKDGLPHYDGAPLGPFEIPPSLR